ncbi:hypothetical protein Q8F55_008647 [Vanrija albida]|uniref:F-box domain-containing protein n=1 Tax=Vanrija albida TaxID=181172 RepID=A0ABR3PRE7_9TREE
MTAQLDHEGVPHIFDDVFQFSDLGGLFALRTANRQTRNMVDKLIQGATLTHDRLISKSGKVIYTHSATPGALSLLYFLVSRLTLRGPSFILPHPAARKPTLDWLRMFPDAMNEYEGRGADYAWPDHVNFRNLATFVYTDLWEHGRGDSEPSLKIGVSPVTDKVTICVHFQETRSGDVYIPTLWLKSMSTPYPKGWEPSLSPMKHFQISHFRQTTNRLNEVVLVVTGKIACLYNGPNLSLLLEPLFLSPVAFNKFTLVCRELPAALLVGPPVPDYFSNVVTAICANAPIHLTENRPIHGQVYSPSEYASLVGPEEYANATDMCKLPA